MLTLILFLSLPVAALNYIIFSRGKDINSHFTNTTYTSSFLKKFCTLIFN